MEVSRVSWITSLEVSAGATGSGSIGTEMLFKAGDSKRCVGRSQEKVAEGGEKSGVTQAKRRRYRKEGLTSCDKCC